MRARYNRISTANQNLERQLAKHHPDEKLYNDVVSGSTAFSKREKGKELVNEIDNGHISYLSVSSIDRLGRNMFDIIRTLEYLNERKVTLKVDNLGLESMVNGKRNPTFNLIFSVLANVSQMERESLRERQLEGIAIAKAKGIYKGRIRGTVESAEVVLAKYKSVVKHLNRKLSLRITAKQCGVSLGTVQKVKAILKKNREYEKL